MHMFDRSAGPCDADEYKAPGKAPRSHFTPRRCIGAHLSWFVVFVRRLGVPQRVPGLSGSDGVRCLAGGSLWRLRLVSTQAGESTNAQRITNWFHQRGLKREKQVSFHPDLH